MRKPICLPSGAVFDLSSPAKIMAIVNCNDDSFYAPSRSHSDKAVAMALEAEEDGADIIDFGGESTRPGSSYVSEEEEIQRVIPVIAAFRKRSSCVISVDTRKASVAKAALDNGADIINDISALADDPFMGELCAKSKAALVLMHKKGIPLTMQEAPWYDDVVEEVVSYLGAAAKKAVDAGVSREKIIFDPGIGFGKRLEDNLQILRDIKKIALHPRLAEICGNDYPILVGLSRKSFIQAITGRAPDERLWGTLAANAHVILGGAAIVRVHDVKAHVDLIKMLSALSFPPVPDGNANGSA
ncbi:MAG: dihydropteroate synthase [Treponema sp.]|nr:dihydropteroate synthase [Treponema sp.]